MMDYNAIIEAFIQVLKDHEYSLAPQTIVDLSDIDQTLSALQNQPIKLAADAILAWCKEHPEFRDQVWSHYHKTRELEKAGSDESPTREITMILTYPDIKEQIEERQNRAT